MLPPRRPPPPHTHAPPRHSFVRKLLTFPGVECDKVYLKSSSAPAHGGKPLFQAYSQSFKSFNDVNKKACTESILGAAVAHLERAGLLKATKIPPAGTGGSGTMLYTKTEPPPSPAVDAAADPEDAGRVQVAIIDFKAKLDALRDAVPLLAASDADLLGWCQVQYQQAGQLPSVLADLRSRRGASSSRAASRAGSAAPRPPLAPVMEAASAETGGGEATSAAAASCARSFAGEA